MAIDLPVEHQIVALAGRQHGNVTRRQLLELGLGHHAIAYRVRTGRLHRVHLGVYSVGRPPKTVLENAAAAVLACGEDALLSRAAALWLWGFSERWPRRFDVIVLGDRRPKGIAVHRCTLHRRDVRRHNGIRVTSPARTLLDCAPRLSRRTLTRVVNDALRSEHLSKSHLAEIVERCPGHRGARLIKPFALMTDGLTRSGLEDDFKVFCDRFGIPTPKINSIVGGYEVDAYFEAEGLIVELDGWGFHSDRDSFERDRDWDADELAMGLATVRITGERMHGDPRREADRLLEILRRLRAAKRRP